MSGTVTDELCRLTATAYFFFTKFSFFRFSSEKDK